MNLELGKTYFFKVKIFGRELDYEGKVVYLDKDEFRIKTEEDCSLNFKLEDLISFREMKDSVKGEKVFIVRKKGPLKEVEGPEGL